MKVLLQINPRIHAFFGVSLASMNGPLRQRELMRVAQENRAILARIEAARPHYNHKKWVSWSSTKTMTGFHVKMVV